MTSRDQPHFAASFGLTLVALAGALCAPSLQAESWPEFRGPTAQGISSAKAAPLNWSATNGIAWKTPLEGSGWSSPVVEDGRVYLTTAVKQDDGGISLRVVCLSGGEGKILWDREALRSDPGTAAKIHSKNSLASPTPILSGGRIYAHFGHMGSAALDLDGKVLWTQTSLSYSPVHGNGGSQLLINGKLIFGCDGGSDPFLAALDANTGSILWKTPRNTVSKRTFTFSTPIALMVDGKTQVVNQSSGFVAGYDPGTGAEIWRVLYGEGYSVVPRPVAGHGLLYITTGFDTAKLLAIRPEGAKGDSTETAVVWQVAKGVPTTPSPILVGGEIYMVSDGGIASCLDAKTGKIHWSERLGGDFSASPILAAGRLYFQNESGLGFVIKPGSEFQLLAKNDLGERTLASYAVIENDFLIRSSGHLWRINGK